MSLSVRVTEPAQGEGPWTLLLHPPPLSGLLTPWLNGRFMALAESHTEAATGSVCHQVGHRHGCAVDMCPTGGPGPLAGPGRAATVWHGALTADSYLSPRPGPGRQPGSMPARAPVCIFTSSRGCLSSGRHGNHWARRAGPGVLLLQTHSPCILRGGGDQGAAPPPCSRPPGLWAPGRSWELWALWGAGRVVPGRLRSPLSSQLVWAWDPLCSPCPQASELLGNLHPRTRACTSGAPRAPRPV